MRKAFLLTLAVIVLIVAGILAYYQTTRTNLYEVLSQFNPEDNVSEQIYSNKTNPVEKKPNQVIVQGTARTLYLPDGYTLSVYASGLGKARMMAVKDKVLYVSSPPAGKVIALPDADNDGRADSTIVYAENLDYPHGLYFYDDALYIAGESTVYRTNDNNNDLKADAVEEVVTNLPTGGHSTRTIVVHNDKIYLSIGSSCNVCREEESRGMILQYNIEGTNQQVFAKGLRNAVGLIYDEKTEKFWATDNGRDFLGDNLPPEEINIVEQGKDYGWPICYGQKIHDTDFDKNQYIRDPCEDTVAPVVEMQAHSAPLGLWLYHGTAFPGYDNTIFTAFHGSWNRREPTGYKVVAIKFTGKNYSDYVIEDFLTGFLVDRKAWGRPVDIIFSEDGKEMFVTDDFAGVIYRITRI